MLLLQIEAHNEQVKTRTATPRQLWYLLLAQALSQTQHKLRWTTDAALLIEEKQPLFPPGALLPIAFAKHHLWIDFETSLATPVCQETAGLLVCVGSDTSLFSAVAQQLRIPAHTLKKLHQEYKREQHLITLNVFHQSAQRVWSIGLDARSKLGQQFFGGTWIAPSWYKCPTQSCQVLTSSPEEPLHSQRVVFCSQCQAAQDFFSSWLAAAWQSLLGTYREKPEEAPTLDTIGEAYLEKQRRTELAGPGAHELRNEVGKRRRAFLTGLVSQPNRVPGKTIGSCISWHFLEKMEQEPLYLSQRSARMSESTDFLSLPKDLPEPIDDGACRHLPGLQIPSVPLMSTTGSLVDLASLPGRTVVYCYPRTGRPGEALPEGWDLIPGARGCTPQSCAFRDHYQELRQKGASFVFGLSTQMSADQQEAANRLHLPFALLSDAAFAFARALRLPTFEVAGMTLLKRLTLIIDHGTILKVFYPVFPPGQNATDVLAWLAEQSQE